MRFAVGSDHAGFDLKEHLKGRLTASGHEVDDLGTHSRDSTDYPRFAQAVAIRVAAGAAERGLLVCGTGIGMAIGANRVPGVRAVAAADLFSARMAREHNDANVLALGARIVAPPLAEAILEAFVTTSYAGGRHQRRVEQLDAASTETPAP